MDLVDRVAAALQRSVLPAVIARGGALRVVAVEDGIATLEVRGSPGAVLPLVSRIQDLLGAAVPEVTGVRIENPGAQPPPGPGDGTVADRVRHVLDAEINPVIAAHRGRVALVEVDQGWVCIRLEGGCQGCSLAEVTIRQGIEPLLRAHIPEMVGLADVTDHEAGTEPFFSAEKR
ncbi:MAG TPA: NifU family protein [Actinomycetes bacterium]|jgi:Fe-S cluster biogenesis protein NfuA|nr:NifU family protein [Actinomycetes bacterium]